MTTFLIVLPYALALPYVGLMVLVLVGLFRRDPVARTDARPSLSVVIPAHDEEASLPGTLASLSAQRRRSARGPSLTDDSAVRNRAAPGSVRAGVCDAAVKRKTNAPVLLLGRGRKR